MTGLLARGHLLLEGLPGLGKTELVKGVAEALGLDAKRVQFTPDLLPGDITGNPMLRETPQGRKLVFQPGPVFANSVVSRRDQSRLAQDAVGTAGSHAGATGDGDGRVAHVARSVLRHRHAEPD